jgi:AcrR family transcriptional regulator
LEAVDEVGPQNFSMRMLADRLSSGTATLYRHIESKEEIFVYLVDRVLGEVDVDDQALAKMPWQKACTLVATAFYHVLSGHPNVVPLLAAQIPLGPNGRKNRERLVGILLAGGFSAEMAACAYATMAHYVVGFAIQQHAAGTAIAQHHDELRDAFFALDVAEYPATVRVARELAAISFDEQFFFGFELIITGLERRRVAQPAVHVGAAVSNRKRATVK